MRGQGSNCTPIKQTVLLDEMDPRLGQTSPLATPSSVSTQEEEYRTGNLRPQNSNARIDRLEDLLESTSNNMSILASTVSELREEITRGRSMPHDASPAKKRRVDSDGPVFIGEQIQSLIENTVLGIPSKLVKQPQNSEGFRSVALQFLRLLPGPQQSKLLVDYYFDNVDWITRVLHPERTQISFQRLAMVSPEDTAMQCHPPVLCCYLIVVVLGLHFATPGVLQAIGMSESQAQVLCDSIYEGCYKLLLFSDIIGSGELEHLSCIILMSIYQHDRKKYSRDHWVFLGMAIKVAQGLGCHMLDDKSVVSTHSRFSLPTEREVGRRIYWNLIWLDWSHASSNGGMYSIHPSQSHTALPSNCAFNGSQLVPKSPEEYTTSLYLIFSCRYVEILRNIIDDSNKAGGPLGREHVEKYTALYNEIRSSTPSCLSYRAEDITSKFSKDHDKSRLMESITLELMYHNRLLRLNRTFQLAGYQDDRWKFARIASVNAAQSIVLILKDISEKTPAVLKYWLTSLYVLGAATTLVIELCCSTDATSNLAFCREYIKSAIELLDSVGSSSQAAKISQRVLSELLSAEHKVREVFSQTENMNKMAEAAKGPAKSQMKDIFYDILGKALRGQAQEDFVPKNSQPSFKTPSSLVGSFFPDNNWNADTDYFTNSLSSIQRDKFQEEVLSSQEVGINRNVDPSMPGTAVPDFEDPLFRVLAWTFNTEDLT